MTEKPRETQAESHVVELKEKVNNSSLMKHRALRNGIAVSILLAIPLCNANQLRIRIDRRPS